MPVPEVAVVAFDQISPFHLAVPCVVLSDAHPGAPLFRVRVCAGEAPPLRTTAGFDVQVAHGLDTLSTADIIIVPSWRDPAERPPASLLDAVRAAHARGAMLVGLCLGAYVLAEAGLLDGRTATTHWAFADDFARRFPGVRVNRNVLYVEDGSVLTSAGTAAGIDCCLHMLRQRHGSDVANAVARRLVVPPHRQGGQAQYIEQPIPESAGDARLSDLLDWVRSRLEMPHSLDSLADRALMSRRTLSRRFRQLTGQSVAGWLLAERLRYAQRLLEQSDLPVDHIAQHTGIGSGAALRSRFRAAFGVSPNTWRSSFRGNPDPLRTTS